MYVKQLLGVEPYTWEGNTVYEPIKENLTTGLVVQCIEVNQPSPMHSHSDVEQIYLISSGRGLVTVDGETVEVTPDDLVFIPAGADHCIAPAGGGRHLAYLTICHHHAVTKKQAG